MSIEVLVSTMHRTDHSLLAGMNLQTDAVVINQCDRYDYEEFDYGGHRVRWFCVKERGVGLSRNTALARAEADIVLFADDDVRFEDGLAEKIEAAFREDKKAGMIVFNILSGNPERPEYRIRKRHRLHWYNCLKYGACRIAVRRSRFDNKNIWYSHLFGGGTKHQAGEDNLFITKAVRSGIRCLADPRIIGTAEQKESSWFKGYTEKYFSDRGALFAAMYGKAAYPVTVLFEMRRPEPPARKFRHLRTEMRGIRGYLTFSGEYDA